MSSVHSKRSKVKKLEDSFSDKQSEPDHHQDDTELQTAENPNPTKHKRSSNKSEQKEIKVKKKEEEHFSSSKIQSYKNTRHLKTYQDEDKIQPNTRLKKYEAMKSIKNDAEQEDQENEITPKMTRTRKKNAKNVEKMEETERRANQIIDFMDEVYEADVELYRKGKPADRKLKCILDISKKLKEIELAKNFLNMNGHLLFTEWLIPNESTQQETSLTVKIHVLNLLLDLQLSKENIETAAELEKVLKKHRKSRFGNLRELSTKIIEKWKLTRALQNA